MILNKKENFLDNHKQNINRGCRNLPATDRQTYKYRLRQFYEAYLQPFCKNTKEATNNE